MVEKGEWILMRKLALVLFLAMALSAMLTGVASAANGTIWP